MKSDYQTRGDIGILRLLEPIVDMNNIGDFRDLLEERAREGAGPMVLDLTETSYIGSVGLGMISLISIMLKKEERVFAVVVGADEVRRLFEISGLQKVMIVEDSIDSACKRAEESA